MTDTIVTEPATPAHFREPESLPTDQHEVLNPDRKAKLHERRSFETRLKAARSELTSLVGNLAKARWKAVATIIDALRWTHVGQASLQMFDIGHHGVQADANALVEYVFANDRGTAVSQVVGIIKHACAAENIPNVYEWISNHHGLDNLYREVVAKPQKNPRPRHAVAATVPADRTEASGKAERAEVEALSDRVAAPPCLVPGPGREYPPGIQSGGHDVEDSHAYLLKIMRLAFHAQTPEPEAIAAFKKARDYIGNADLLNVFYNLARYDYLAESAQGRM